jgi:hypothetical protein
MRAVVTGSSVLVIAAVLGLRRSGVFVAVVAMLQLLVNCGRRGRLVMDRSVSDDADHGFSRRSRVTQQQGQRDAAAEAECSDGGSGDHVSNIA